MQKLWHYGDEIQNKHFRRALNKSVFKIYLICVLIVL